jgi:hypothetical protein
MEILKQLYDYWAYLYESLIWLHFIYFEVSKGISEWIRGQGIRILLMAMDKVCPRAMEQDLALSTITSRAKTFIVVK